MAGALSAHVHAPGPPPAGAKKHGGPVEVLYQLTPVMSLTLLLLSLGHEKLWERLPASPYFATVGMGLLSCLIIFGGAIIAFAMVVAEFALIANTSALTFMVAGTFKEIVTGGAAATRNRGLQRQAGGWEPSVQHAPGVLPPQLRSPAALPNPASLCPQRLPRPRRIPPSPTCPPALRVQWLRR